MNVLTLVRMLGHTSAKVTLDTYADLFDSDLDVVAETLHTRYAQTSVPNVCPKQTLDPRLQTQKSPSPA